MRYVALVAIAVIAALAAVCSASATVPGKNGLITFFAVTPDEGA